jgi:hypothetical protein
MRARSTPGPWFVDERDEAVIRPCNPDGSKTGYILATVRRIDSPLSMYDSMGGSPAANAALIAAAPEMYEKGRALLEAYRLPVHNAEDAARVTGIVCAAEEAFEAVLDAAEGE